MRSTTQDTSCHYPKTKSKLGEDIASRSAKSVVLKPCVSRLDLGTTADESERIPGSLRSPMELTAQYDDRTDSIVILDGNASTIPREFDVRLLSLPSRQKVQIHVSRRDAFTKGMRITLERCRDWDDLPLSHLGMLLDAAVTLLVDSSGEDLFCVQPLDANKVWLFAATGNEPSYDAMILTRNALDLLDLRTFYHEGFGAFHTQPDDDSARRLYQYLLEPHGLDLPSEFPLFKKAERVVNRHLTVKVGRGAEWMLLFPLNYFASHAHFGRLSDYEHVEWIVTPKSFLRNCRERRAIHSELSDIHTVLSRSCFIFNEYSHFEKQAVAPDYQELRALVEKVLNLLEDVSVVNEAGTMESLSIRWRKNPPPDEVARLFRDETIQYLFADFHVEGGRWRIPSSDGSASDFDLSQFKRGDLAHIRLLRVFHCNSVFDPYEPREINSSIVQRLLDLGASRVEGSTQREEYTDFLKSVLKTVAGADGLKPIVLGKSFEREINLQNLGSQLERFGVRW